MLAMAYAYVWQVPLPKAVGKATTLSSAATITVLSEPDIEFF